MFIGKFRRFAVFFYFFFGDFLEIFFFFLEIVVFQYCKHFPKSRCRPSRCLVAVYAVFLVLSSPIYSLHEL